MLPKRESLFLIVVIVIFLLGLWYCKYRSGRVDDKVVFIPTKHQKHSCSYANGNAKNSRCFLDEIQKDNDAEESQTRRKGFEAPKALKPRGIQKFVVGFVFPQSNDRFTI